MSQGEVISIARSAIWVLIETAGPAMLVGLGVGLLISVVQAVTQVQEMTLAFIPKILAMFAAILIFLPFMMSNLSDFMNQIAARIASLH
jgi:flagellar biosynthetic protein FliQ